MSRCRISKIHNTRTQWIILIQRHIIHQLSATFLHYFFDNCFLSNFSLHSSGNFITFMLDFLDYPSSSFNFISPFPSSWSFCSMLWGISLNFSSGTSLILFLISAFKFIKFYKYNFIIFQNFINMIPYIVLRVLIKNM